MAATVPAVSLHPPTIADVKGAAAILSGVAVRTPLLAAPILSRRLGRTVFIKPEMLQVTGSFKFRGAYHFISRIPAPDRTRGVVAYSSGNHAQGVAAAAAAFAIPATIVMPADAPATKIARTKGHGATVVFYDRETESREEIAAAIAAAGGATVLPPYDHPWTMAGQGTIGLEIAADWDRSLEAPIVLVPASGGGLAAGIGIALEAELAGACVHLVEPDGFDDHARSLASGKREVTDRTSGSICDALLNRTPGAITFEVNRRLAGAAGDGRGVRRPAPDRRTRWCRRPGRPARGHGLRHRPGGGGAERGECGASAADAGDSVGRWRQQLRVESRESRVPDRL
jgi:threonine dehydratase